MHTIGHWIWRYQYEGELVEAQVTPLDKNQFKVIIKEQEHLIHVNLENDTLFLETNHQKMKVTVDNKEQQLTLYTEIGQTSIDRFSWKKLDVKTAAQKGQLTAPMPATVVAILKKTGEKVKAGDGLIVLEAMKMEHTVYAPTDGVLLDVFYKVGSQVNEGAELLSFAEEG
jgi:3-methylcrotonyl-CoA carboxylase alpha subunit